MARLKMPGCCECGAANCEVRQLVALHTRHGFPVLYITSIFTGSEKRSKLRYLQKTIDYSFTFSVGSGTEYDYHATIDVVERLTGKIDYSESSALTLSTSRTQAISRINSLFNTYKDTANGVYVSGNETTTIDWTFVGVDIVIAHFTRVSVETFPEDRTYTEEWTVTLAVEYTDTDFKADVDDLLAQNTGSGVGLNGVADRTMVQVNWNGNGVNTAIGNGTTGASDHNKCAIDPTSLSAYTSTADPTLQVTVYDPDDLFAIYGVTWWQHPGGGDSNGEPDGESWTVYNCEFEADTSMPHVLIHSGLAWSTEARRAIRFNITTDLCVEYDWEDDAGATETRCYLVSPGGGHVDWTEPHPEAVANSNINRWAGTWTFTSPGALTAGDCPCTGAP